MRTVVLAAMMVLGTTAAARDRSYEPGDGRGRLFVSPMGEPFRADHAPERQWFNRADADGDGRITRPEFEADAARFFAVLDANGDGEIDPSEIDRYETVLAPEIRVRERPAAEPAPPSRSDRGMGGQGMHFGSGGETRPKVVVREGAARFGYLDLPEPVVAADRDGNRGIDRTEFAYAADARFALLDRNGDGAITRGELPRLPTTR